MDNRIKPEFLERIREDDYLILLIAQAMGKRWRTVYQWVRYGSEHLTLPAVLHVICEYYKLPKEDVLEEHAAA